MLIPWCKYTWGRYGIRYSALPYSVVLLVYVASGHSVQVVFLCIKVAELEPDDASRDEREHRHGAVVPHEQRVGRER